MSNNGHLRKEVFSTPVDIPGLIYATTTEVYREGILTAMYTFGHFDTKKEGPARLGKPFEAKLSNPNGVCHKEFAKAQEQKLAELFETSESLPSN